MAKMNPNHILASYDLGHSRMNTFWKVTIPYLMPAILTAIAVVFSMSWDDFIITNLINGSFQTLGTLLYTTRKGIKAWVVTFGAIVTMITLLVVIIIGINKYVKMKKATKKKMLATRS
jgi:spermidine/putrescine transport system permease protein